ncbi:MinD/ParA family protein [Mycobacterium sp.]|uniref:nucleotide-binding protein n=1 Tax=Mycobacterium sp. TaxID=1785 RepID=UPI002BA8467E|nr:MinD/ParA family protein [Mycobacterium sp.]HKP42844.1 MinD/ParA family protein [Mycobacterium sp.]
MTDRDDALRRELGWTGPEESDFEPDTGPAEPPPPAAAPVPRRPPVDFVPSRPPETVDKPAPADAAEPLSTGANRLPPEPPVTGAHQESPRGTGEGPPPPPFHDPEPPRGSFREPPHLAPPPPPARDSRQSSPHAGRPDSGQWGPPPGWQAPRPPRPLAQQPPHSQQPASGRPGRPWPAHGYGQDGGAPRPAPTGSYADRIRADDLVPLRRTPPARGWRLALYKATFGLVNLGQSPDEIQRAELVAKIKSVLRGHYKVGVMGKGGVGKTTVSASVGSVFAELRQDDRVVAIDADTAFGKLGSRVDPKAQGSYWELASDQHLETFADVRSRVGNNAAGLFVLAGEGTPARRRVLDPAIYREATTRLDRYFTISIIDCSSTMDTPVTQEVLRDLDALIVVSSPWVDGAAAAGQTLDWLAARGLTGLLQRTVIVLNDSDGHADKRTRSILAQQFASQGQKVIEVPFDGHLRPGGVIDRTSEMSPAARRRFLEIAAALAEHFPSQDDRSRERY